MPAHDEVDMTTSAVLGPSLGHIDIVELVAASVGSTWGEHFGLSDSDADRVVSMAQAHRVVGPSLVALFESGVDAPVVTEALVNALQGAMAWCLELELRLLEVKQWFDEVGGVEFLVLKGAAVAHLDEFDPMMRSFADLDLLIHARDMDRAITTLEDHGAVRYLPQRHRGFDRRFAKGVGTTCPDGIEIDIHRTLCGSALGFRIPLDELFAHPDHFEVGGHRFAALRLEHRALHAAYHAMVGSSEPALHTLRDLAQYLQRPNLSPDVLVAEAARWRGETVLAEAVRSAIETLKLDIPAWQEWLAVFLPDSRDLDLIRRSSLSKAWPIEWSLLRELRWRDRLAFTWAVGVPSREVRSERGLTLRTYFSSGARRSLQRRRRLGRVTRR